MTTLEDPVRTICECDQLWVCFPLLYNPIHGFGWQNIYKIANTNRPKETKIRPTTTLKTFDNSHAIRIITRWKVKRYEGRSNFFMSGQLYDIILYYAVQLKLCFEDIISIIIDSQKKKIFNYNCEIVFWAVSHHSYQVMLICNFFITNFIIFLDLSFFLHRSMIFV